MKVIITGATGMVGQGVLLECLDDARVEKVLTTGRTATGMQHPKLMELVHPDFLNWDAVKNQLSGYDACYLCMGVSSAGMKEETFHKLTYDYTLALGTVLLRQNPGMTCTYVSGQGTDSTEKGRVMWARVKGKTENALLHLGFRQAYMFRPGIIIPLRGIRSKTKSYQFMYDNFMWLVKIVRLFAPKSVVNTTQIGKAMITVGKKGYYKNIINPADIQLLANAPTA